MDKPKKSYEAYREAIIELVAFAKRPGMYVGNNNIDLILAFIGGIALSTKFKLQFGQDLIEYIFEKYKDKGELQQLKQKQNYFTLKEQLAIISKLNDKTEVENFSHEASEFLVHVSDDHLAGLFRSKLKSDLIMYLLHNVNSEDIPFTTSFKSSPEDSIFRFFEEWPGIGMPSKQFDLLKSIKEINSKRNLLFLEQKAGAIDDKSELRLKSNELLDLLSKDDTW